MGILSDTIDQLRERVDDAFVDRIDPDLWHRIRNMDAGQNEYGFDPFGFEPEFLKYVGAPASFFFDHYFRTETFDIENIPDQGAVMLISNHSGQVAIDGFLIGCACLFRKDPPRMVRSMVEHWVPTLPFVSTAFSRMGQVVGTRENARILLGRGGCLSVFPEGVRGITKTYDQAYELQRFGNGFMRLALETNTPIVPIGVVGGEEQIPSVWNVESIAKIFGMPAFPVTPAMLLLGPLGALPLPVKYRIYFGEPMAFEGKADDEDRVIAAKVDQVKAEIERLIARGLDEREGVFF
jgi:1-acyl-sn-glycerol-3-phosphate acyltransferase